MPELFAADLRLERRRANGVMVNVRYDAAPGATRLPLLLLHGFPQTHAMWHRVAERLRRRFVLVLPDLRGYGDSEKPDGPADHSAYSKRTMALDALELMRGLGFESFLVCGHDRGARVAHRLALDHHEGDTRHAMQAFVCRPGHRGDAAVNEDDRFGTEAAHAIDEQPNAALSARRA